jgi:hypothetical protein
MKNRIEKINFIQKFEATQDEARKNNCFLGIPFHLAYQMYRTYKKEIQLC